MNLISFVDDCIANYGKNGDDSLEFIGLVINQEKICTKRAYRKKGQALDLELATGFPYLQAMRILSNFISMNGVKVCDISLDSSNGEKLARIDFLLPSQLPHEMEQQYLEKFFVGSGIKATEAGVTRYLDIFSRINSTEYSPLFQLGAEITDAGMIVGVKYYLNFGPGSIASREKKCFTYLLETKKPIEVSKRLNMMGYYPAFIGINERQNEIEEKLYFRSRAFGHQTQDILPNSSAISKYLGWDIILPEYFFEQLWERNIYLEGIALSFLHPTVWRLYFSALPRTQV